MIKNVIFDMDGVIRGLKNSLVSDILPENLKEKYAAKYEGIEFKNYVQKWHEIKNIFNLWDKGKLTGEEVLQEIINFSNEPDEVVRSLFELHLSKEHRIVFPQTIELIKKLKTEGYNVYVLSNMGKENVELITTKLIDTSLFDSLLFSCEAGYAKPEADFYNFAIDKWSIKPEESIFIDDMLANLVPFENLGGFTFLFDSKNINQSVDSLYNLIKHN